MRLTITADRDSVCAGDDCISHQASFSIAASCNALEVLAAAWRVCPLAGIAGAQATWLIDVIGRQGPIGVMAQQWDAPKLLIPPNATAQDLFNGTTTPSLYFRYWCQSNPDALFEAIRTQAPLPAKYS